MTPTPADRWGGRGRGGGAGGGRGGGGGHTRAGQAEARPQHVPDVREKQGRKRRNVLRHGLSRKVRLLLPSVLEKRGQQRRNVLRQGR